MSGGSIGCSPISALPEPYGRHRISGRERPKGSTHRCGAMCKVSKGVQRRPPVPDINFGEVHAAAVATVLGQHLAGSNRRHRPSNHRLPPGSTAPQTGLARAGPFGARLSQGSHDAGTRTLPARYVNLTLPEGPFWVWFARSRSEVGLNTTTG